MIEAYNLEDYQIYKNNYYLWAIAYGIKVSIFYA